MTGESPQRCTFYPEIEPYRTGILRVSDLHEIYFEESGNPQGKPVFPDAWEEFLAPIPVDERGNLLHAYYDQLTSSDPDVQKTAAKAWSIW